MPGPRDHLELEVTVLWRAILNKQDVGGSDDFFEAGGDSLSASVMAYRLPSPVALTLPTR